MLALVLRDDMPGPVGLDGEAVEVLQWDNNKKSKGKFGSEVGCEDNGATSECGPDLIVEKEGLGWSKPVWELGRCTGRTRWSGCLLTAQIA